MIKIFDGAEIKKRLDYINLIDALEKIFLKVFFMIFKNFES